MRRLLLGTAVLALGLAGAQAQEERAIDHFSGVGVRAMGMGGAFAGVADDFSAIFWNPAGLAQLRQFEVYTSFLRNDFSDKSNQAGTTASAELTNTRFGSLGVVLPYPVYQGSLVFAAGFNRAKDFDYALRIRGLIDGMDNLGTPYKLQTNDSFTHEGEIAMTSVAGAVDVAPAVALGVAFNFLSGEDQILNQFERADVEDHVLEKRFVARETFADDYPTAFTATLGALFRSAREKPKVRLGATLSSGATHQVRYTFKGLPSLTAYDLVEYDNGTVRQNVEQREDGTFVEVAQDEVRGSYKISLPLEFGLGISGQPVAGLLVAGSAHWAGWSEAKYQQGGDLGALRANNSFQIQYRDVTRYHLGAEWQVPVVALDLRAGFYTDPLPFVGPRDPQLSVGPDNPLIAAKQDRRFYTLGAGLLFEEVVRADLAWTHGSFEQVEGLLAEKASTDRVMVGISCRF